VVLGLRCRGCGRGRLWGRLAATQQLHEWGGQAEIKAGITKAPIIGKNGERGLYESWEEKQRIKITQKKSS